MFNFCDFLVPILTWANQPNWSFIFFSLQEGHIALDKKKYHTRACHFGTYTKYFSFLGPMCTEIWYSKVGWFWGGGSHLIIVQWRVPLFIKDPLCTVSQTKQWKSLTSNKLADPDNAALYCETPVKCIVQLVVLSLFAISCVHYKHNKSLKY